MRRYALLMLVFAAIVLAGCGTAPNFTPTWCYTYDLKSLTYPDYGFGVAAGVWIPDEGLRTDAGGNLIFSYARTGIVSPRLVTVYVEKDPARAAEGVDISVLGTIYGISANFNYLMPSGETSKSASFQPAQVGDGGTLINVNIQAVRNSLPLGQDHAGAFRITAISVIGDGVDPQLLPYNSCQPTATPTQTRTRSPLSPQPSPTQLPTETLQPTETALPTETPAPTSSVWECVYDFSNGQQGWASSWAPDVLWAGSYWYNATSPSGYATIFRPLPIGGTLTRVRVQGSANKPRGTTTSRGWGFPSVGNAQYPIPGWDSATGSYDVQWTGSVTISESAIYVGLGSAGIGGALDLRINSITLAGSGTSPSNCSITSTATRTPTSTRTPTPTRTPTGTILAPTRTQFPQTNTPVSTPTRTPFVVIPNPTSTPRPPSSTPSSTVMLPPTATMNPTYLTQTPELLTATAIYGGTPTAAAMTATYQGTATALALTGTPVPDVIQDAGQTGGNAVGASGNVIALAGDYLSQMGAAVNGVFGAWNTAIPQAVPGLPQCATDPVSSAICAIWYILENTILTGIVGQQLIPICCRILELRIVMTFIKMARAIIVRLGKLRQV